MFFLNYLQLLPHMMSSFSVLIMGKMIASLIEH